MVTGSLSLVGDYSRLTFGELQPTHSLCTHLEKAAQRLLPVAMRNDPCLARGVLCRQISGRRHVRN